MFTCSNVKYKDVLNIPTLTIEEGLITCIVGESGGGKTTFLKCLNKMISPTSGTITYKGEDLTTLHAVDHRKNVVLLTQNPFIFQGNVRDNLQKALYYHKKKMTDDDMIAYLRRVKFMKNLEDDASVLSGGEAQRLALARVLILDSEVYLLDEPSSALDEETERIVVEQIVTFVRENKKTLIMVTHSKEVAKKYGDCLFTIEKGKVTERNCL